MSEKFTSELINKDQIQENINLESQESVENSESVQELINLASNENTEPELLSQLAYHENLVVSKLALANPSIAPEVLDIFIENTNLATDEESLKIRQIVALSPNISTPSLEVVLLDDDCLGCALLNPLFTLAVLDNPKLLELAVEKIKYAYLEGKNLEYFSNVLVGKIETFEEIKNAIDSSNIPRYIAVVAKDEELITGLYEQNLNNQSLLKCIARNLNTPTSILEELQGTSPQIDYYISANPNTSEGLLRKMYERRVDYAVVQFAKNPNTPEDILMDIYCNNSIEIKQKVLRNPNFSQEFIRQLANTGNFELLSSITQNPSTPSDLLAKLSQSRNESILMNIASHENTSDSTLEYLANSNFDSVRLAVSRSPKSLNRELKSFFGDNNPNRVFNRR